MWISFLFITVHEELAAAARSLPGSPERIALMVTGFGVLSFIVGLSASLHRITSTGPLIVMCCSSLRAFLKPQIVKNSLLKN
jgi:ABC-type Mn2+/Zn2+ transport system permease subunit